MALPHRSRKRRLSKVTANNECAVTGATLREDKAQPFVPTEIHVSTVEDDRGTLGILSIQTTEGMVEIAIDRQAADAIVNAIGATRTKLDQR